jgi:hypothetical protein
MRGGIGSLQRTDPGGDGQYRLCAAFHGKRFDAGRFASGDGDARNADAVGVDDGPGGESLGTALSTQPVLEIRDAQGNLATEFDGGSDSRGRGSGRNARRDDDGQRGRRSRDLQWADVGGDRRNELRSDRFTASGSTPIDSGNLTVTHGAPTQLALTTPPVGGLSGAPLPTQPVVTIQDAQGNTVTDSTAAVAVAIQSGSGGSLSGATTVSAVNGVATFNGLTLAGTPQTRPMCCASARGR